MRRRELLTAAGSALTAGCVGRSIGGKRSDERVDDMEFSVRNAAGETDVDAPPDVEFRPASKRVVVTGALWVGSGSCNEAKLRTVSYDETSDVLDVTVESGEKDGLLRDVPFLPVFCTADMTADAYELVVTFRNRLPKTVVAAERDGKPERTTAARPVD